MDPKTATRADLVDAYAHAMLEAMSTRDLERFFLDVVCERLDNESDAALRAEIADFYPELLEA